ncbi:MULTISPECIES: TetR/AcrR family transcriptional regulator [Vibrio]|jgi:TetR/AcrR family transcriptional repressor of nem operon|uniref:TetR/AcrR family transcriptional regulator n=5 Tax=Vibrionaceae TaxID=641 RepID=A0A0H0YD91_VIBAL|nr:MULTISPECIES: TetR/AcrR family transcriptional regulator [Vibrio]EEZ83072.1 putative transcriptional regulator [Vibrio alginolyticus 40B]MDG2664876.1 TetR/AcrR family transcriptional regulator [Vibrio parahaemolyticus]MDW1810002.1 TetR/AcrR family transcriptional regulator [Vibrio sp. Vb2362]MDW2259683.1 TetR/AcrR family transcriptional regulator [Vibrio sp. 1409]MDW2293927.1 TetR/AcrR family transcriptional regulator [Vibrio sp. 1404]QCO89083.1 TetR/AcrR family transcriptional regulator [
MNAKTNDTRQHILDVGYELIVNRGFTSVGLSELLKKAAVPKGSFYHYFKSKEQFGEAMIQDYFTKYFERLNARFTNTELSGYQRLMSYFEEMVKVEDDVCNANKCLLVKLSAEVSDLSESMRLALRQGADKTIQAIADCIDIGIQDGSIPNGDSALLARQIYYLWNGASLLNKLYQDQAALTQSLTYTQHLLQNTRTCP